MTTATSSSTEALLGVYKPSGPLFVGGEGSYLLADDGTRYLDFTSGIAVNSLGYGDPEFTAAVRESLESGLVHASNLFRTRPAADLAQWLVENSFADRVFFCNSGAEANEGALKFARRWAREAGGEEKTEIVAFRGGFHGRTMGALSATDRAAYQDPFRPLVPGFHFCDVGDLAELGRLVSAGRTAAVIIEPLQGEGGVQPVPPEFLRAVRRLCDDADALLVFDEVQVGLGRTGNLWAHEAAGVTPDVLTTAKPLAGGLPMGAVLLTERVAAAVKPGDHATTFGGGPLVATAALAVCRKLGDAGFLADVRRKGEWLGERLAALSLGRGDVAEARGTGLIWGLELTGSAGDAVSRALDARLLVITAGPNVIRIVPPLTISDVELEEGMRILEDSL